MPWPGFKKGYYTEEIRRADNALASRIDRSLDASWREGIAAQLMTGAFDYYLVPYALALGATTREIGLLVSVPHLLAAASQFFAVKAVQAAGSRCTLLVKGTTVQAAFLVPLGLLSVLAFPGRIAILIFLMTVFRVTGSLIGPAWGSLMSDYLPDTKRGEYFGWRSRLIGIANVAGVCLWGGLLSGFNQGAGTFGFLLVFMSAAAVRFLSLIYMKRMTDLKMIFTREREFTFWMFLLKIRRDNFSKFALYVAGITFTTQLSVAYFSVYLLQELHFGYLSYTAVQLASVITGIIAYPIWGKKADIAGNAQVLKATSFLIPVMPLLWFISKEPFHFVLAEMFSGFVWSGFNLCSTNFIYDAVAPSRRVRSLGYFNLINSSATFIGASTGGFLAASLPPVDGSSILTLFVVSAILRFGAHLFLSGRFTEVRTTVRRIPRAKLVLDAMGLRLLTGRNVQT